MHRVAALSVLLLLALVSVGVWYVYSTVPVLRPCHNSNIHCMHDEFKNNIDVMWFWVWFVCITTVSYLKFAVAVNMTIGITLSHRDNSTTQQTSPLLPQIKPATTGTQTENGTLLYSTVQWWAVHSQVRSIANQPVEQITVWLLHALYTQLISTTYTGDAACNQPYYTERCVALCHTHSWLG